MAQISLYGTKSIELPYKSTELSKKQSKTLIKQINM